VRHEHFGSVEPNQKATDHLRTQHMSETIYVSLYEFLHFSRRSRVRRPGYLYLYVQVYMHFSSVEPSRAAVSASNSCTSDVPFLICIYIHTYTHTHTRTHTHTKVQNTCACTRHNTELPSTYLMCTYEGRCVYVRTYTQACTRTRLLHAQRTAWSCRLPISSP
jgi:hypothetical protein